MSYFPYFITMMEYVQKQPEPEIYDVYDSPAIEKEMKCKYPRYPDEFYAKPQFIDTNEID